MEAFASACGYFLLSALAICASVVIVGLAVWALVAIFNEISGINVWEKLSSKFRSMLN